MHKSKLAGFIIDCRTDNLESAASFWSAALGMEKERLPGEEGQKYLRLTDNQHGLHIEVQMVGHPSRVHLDIETDDIEAEARRLEALGAKRVSRVETWCVMQAPSGQRFCLVRPQRAGFKEHANVWK